MHRLVLFALSLVAMESFSQSARSTACIESVCLGDGVLELRATRWIDRKPLKNAPGDPLAELKALGPFPGSRALDLVARIPGICEYDVFGQKFSLESDQRVLFATATWVPSLDRQRQRFEVRRIDVKYVTSRSNHVDSLRRLCSDITRKVRSARADTAARCSEEGVNYFRYVSALGDTLVDISGDPNHFSSIDVRLLRIDEWEEQPMDLAQLSKELSKLPACQRK